MPHEWANVTCENVITALRLFETSFEPVPAAKTTFLRYAGKKYPAKHIRGMAYYVAFGEHISKHEYSGGKETVRFFLKLGFTVEYHGEFLSPVEETNTVLKVKPEHTSENQVAPEKSPDKDIGYRKIRITSKDVVEQKNALQRLLNRLLGSDVVSEMHIPWMYTPIDYDARYQKLVDALISYRGDTRFAKKKSRIKCDFVCDEMKLIIEYDERQHFSLARKAALLSYKDDIALDFDSSFWIRACDDIKARDNDPQNRDEIRAYYDSVRDIEANRHGYRLIRIMHGAVDWTGQDSKEQLKLMIEVGCKVIP